ncbi:MAG: hypothetical protein J6C75_06705 [Oscillospiraceae bacterium]|nr:hypothetical protein [Oscillospiraceae bacterium]
MVNSPLDFILTILLSKTAMVIAPFILIFAVGLLIIKRNKLTSEQKIIAISVALLTTAYLLFIFWLASMFG